MAKQATYVMGDDRIDFTATADIKVGDVVPLGTAMVGIALTDIATGSTGVLKTEGCWNVAAKTGESFAIGDVVYLDDVTNALTKTATSNARAGIAIAVKATAETVALIRLNY